MCVGGGGDRRRRRCIITERLRRRALKEANARDGALVSAALVLMGGWGWDRCRGDPPRKTKNHLVGKTFGSVQ